MTQENEERPEAALTNVHRLPVRRAGGELEPAGEVLDGELETPD